MVTTPAISIVIPTLDGAARLPRTLSSLERSRDPGVFEVLVVDDGSTDSASAAASAYSGRLALTVIRHDRNQGRAAARNTGIRAARGPVVLLLDDDMESEPDLVARHLAAHASGEPTAAIGRIETEGLDLEIPFHAFLLREDAWRRERLRSARPGFGEMATGQLSVGRDLAIGAGLFDEEIGRYGLEDIEFAYRLERAGARFLYLDDAVSHHAAYAVALDRYCERHRTVGEMAAYLARRHDTPEMRRYLRIEPVPRQPGRSLFTRLMDASASILRRPRAAAWLATGVPQSLLHGTVRALEAARLGRPLGFAYSFLRDIQYFAALGGARRPAGARGESR